MPGDEATLISVTSYSAVEKDILRVQPYHVKMASFECVVMV